MITLYTRTICPKCILIKGTLDSAGVKYEVKNLDTDTEAEDKIRAEGIMALPIAEYKDKFYIDIKPITALIPQLVE